MPVVELNFSRLQKILCNPTSSKNKNNKHKTSATNTPISKKLIVQTLPFLGLDVESESQDDIRIEYSPNRPDYSTPYGIALGLEGLLGIKKGSHTLYIKKDTHTPHYKITVDSSVSHIRPFITAICAKGKPVDDDLIKQLMIMQEDLHLGIGRKRKKSSIGIHDLDTISFPIRYTTTNRSHKLVPLHHNNDDDDDNVNAPSMSITQILKDTQTGKDYSHLLGSSKLVPVLLDSQNQTLSIPPIINSSNTTVTTKTKNLFIEVTGLHKDDIEDTISVVSTILSKAGFKLYQVAISGSKNSTPNLSPTKMKLDPKLVNDTLGLQLSQNQIISCLKKSRLDAYSLLHPNSPTTPSSSKSSITAKSKTKYIECIIPRYRFDIFGPMDLVEEVALGYGINKLQPKLSPSRTIGSTSIVTDQLYIIDQMLIGLGYTEVLNSSLTSADTLYKATNRILSPFLSSSVQQQQQQQQQPTAPPISVLDSKSKEHTILRDSILPGLVANLGSNTHQPYPQKIYETGTVFRMGATNNTATSISEKMHLAAVLGYQNANFSEVKSALQSLLKMGFNIDIKTKTHVAAPTSSRNDYDDDDGNVTSIPTTTAPSSLFEHGRVADIILSDHTIIGIIGQISTKTLDHFKIRVPVVGFELGLTGLIFD